MILRRQSADFGVAARAQASSEIATDVDLEIGFTEQQRLRIRVGRDELDVLQSRSDHPIHRVRSAAAHANYFDYGVVVALIKTHGLPLATYPLLPPSRGRRREQSLKASQCLHHGQMTRFHDFVGGVTANSSGTVTSTTSPGARVLCAITDAMATNLA